MRAGKLDRTIVIQVESHTAPDRNGNVTAPVWITLGELRAEVISTDEVAEPAEYGQRITTAKLFRTRYFSEAEAGGRIVYCGDVYSIKSVAEIGRRRGLEMRAELVK